MYSKRESTGMELTLFGSGGTPRFILCCAQLELESKLHKITSGPSK